MNTYDGLDSAIGALKRATIDAYMKSSGWTVGDEFYKLWAVGQLLATATKPDSFGNGGGDTVLHMARYGEGTSSHIGPKGTIVTYHVDPDFYKLVARFNTVRSNIDSALAPFRDMPNPGDLDDIVNLCNKAQEGLWLYPDNGVGGTEMESALNSINLKMPFIRGHSRLRFKPIFSINSQVLLPRFGCWL